MKKLLGLLLTATLAFSMDSSGPKEHPMTDGNRLTTKKTSCIQQTNYEGKTLAEQKKILIEQAKQESLEELYGSLIFSSTDIENGKIKNDEIRSRAVGAVRVRGNPTFYNGKNLGEICADVTCYITEKDLEKYSPKEVSLTHYCFNDTSVAMGEIQNKAREAAYKEMIVRYKPSMKNISLKQAEKLIHGFKESNSNFDFATKSYCFDAVGTILPYELEMRPGTDGEEADSTEVQAPLLYKNDFGGKKRYGIFDNSANDSEIDTGIHSDQTGSVSYTILAWVKPNGGQNGAFRARQAVVATDSYDGGYDWAIFMDNNMWTIFSGDTFYNSNRHINVNAWQHLAAVFDVRQRQYKLFVDGKLVISNYLNDNCFDKNTGNFMIGENPSTQFAEHFNGQMGDVKIYQGALNDNLIRNIYESEKSDY